jgi:hypothetical protein
VIVRCTPAGRSPSRQSDHATGGGRVITSSP